MRSAKDYLEEIKEKFEMLETQLTYERKNLNKIRDLLTEDKEKWEKEVKEAEAKVRKTQKEVEEKEAVLNNFQKDFENLRKNALSQDQRKNQLEKDLEEEKERLEESRYLKNKELARVREELEDTWERIKIQKENNDYRKRQQEIDMSLAENAGDKNLKERMIMLSNDLSRKEDELEQDLKGLNSKMVSDRKTLWKIQDQITAAQLESDDLLKKNQKLKDQINLIENLS